MRHFEYPQNDSRRLDSSWKAASEYGKLHVLVSKPLLSCPKTLQGATVAGFYTDAAVAQYDVAKDPLAAREMIRSAAEILPGAMLVCFERRGILNNLRDFFTLPNFTIAFSHALEPFDELRSIMWDHVLSSLLMLQKRLRELPRLGCQIRTNREATWSV